MDKESLQAVMLLETIGQCNAKFMDLSRNLQKHENVISVLREIECATYPITGTTFSIYLDAELRNGNCINFCLLLEWNKNEWVTTARISLIDEQGSKVFKEFPERRTQEYIGVMEHMISATMDLVNAAGIINDL